uniref:ATP synthase subunit a n=1 Tax=Uroplatus fimbriatus TaxID=402375 RepID=A0A0A1H7A7_9SAUR|nr:ATP synthase F0 subunit 6 [Uroplatus fimbriatus]BAP90248.1 ATPase subunit 6 [Uroplatus fimbriatus]
MTLGLFDQFSTPYMLGMPLLLFALLFPMLIIYPPSRILLNRLAMLQTWFSLSLPKHLLQLTPTQAHPWGLPLLSTAQLLILLNLLGLLPYTFTPTTQLALNLALALPFWIATILLGCRNQPTSSLAHLLPQGCPTPLIPALILIETASIFIRPLALGVRITANLTAGHLLIMLVSTATMLLLTAFPLTTPLAWILLLLLTGLELAVAMIQAYVFVLLLTLYLQENF